MDTDLSRWKADRALQWLILFVGCHSCLLGVLMLVAPGLMLSRLGFPGSVPFFFPSQSGVFLLILGLCYLRAMAEPSYVWTIVLSKALAVAFLLVQVIFLGAPPIIWAACAGDASMLVGAGLLLRRHRRQGGQI